MLTTRNHPELGPWVSVHVVDKKARKLRRTRRALVELAKHAVVIEMLPDAMHLIGGPEGQVERFRSLAKTEGVPMHEDMELVPMSRLTRKVS